MQSLPRKTHAFIRQENLLRPGQRVAVAVSGGADSVALLRVMLELREELGIVLSVAHFNHKLRKRESDADEGFVRALAAQYDLQFHFASRNTAQFAQENGLGIEAAARELRYRFFSSLVEAGKVNRVATAHSLDDQAETVLMRLVRGAGPAGLAGVLPELASATFPEDKIIVRPFLTIRRAAARDYLKALGQSWREDASNDSADFMRNRVRQELLPELEKFNLAIAEVLGHAAEIARAEEEYWAEKIAEILAFESPRPPATIGLNLMRKQNIALQRRLIRALAKEAALALDFEHVENVRHALDSITPKIIEVPRGRAQIKDKELSFALGRRNRARAHHPKTTRADVLIEEVPAEEEARKGPSRGTMPGGDSH